ncbi:MAG: DUF2889 domain-containing protein [Novosphingobium sp.]
MRRTSSIDVSWPDGAEGNRRFIGRARDFFTPPSGGPGRVLDAASMQATLDFDKEVKAISAYPEPARLGQLVGQRGGNHLRMVLREVMPELITTGAPLYLLLDDISGVALVSSWAWANWDPDWAVQMRQRIPADQLEKMNKAREGVCWGLQPGNSGTREDLAPGSVGTADAGELRNPADPEGWHEFPTAPGPGFRRARRIDVSRDDEAGVIHIDSAFQDSAPRPGGGRSAIHEYRLSASVDAESLEILMLDPEARILPFSECPGAIHNTERLIGARLDDIRAEVLAQLRGPQGCTHLNDALRALAEVPKLAGYLDAVPA